MGMRSFVRKQQRKRRLGQGGVGHESDAVHGRLGTEEENGAAWRHILCAGLAHAENETMTLRLSCGVVK